MHYMVTYNYYPFIDVYYIFGYMFVLRHIIELEKILSK